MSYCPMCGQEQADDARFCSTCGARLASSVQQPVAAPVTEVVITSPKREGRLAIKTFALSFVIYVCGAVALHTSNAGSLRIWMALTFGVGATYVLVRFRRWKRQNELVTGALTGWIVAVLMGVICLGGLMQKSGDSSMTRTSNTSAASADFSDRWTGPTDVKGIVMQDAKLDFNWSKGGFGSVMMADFTIRNPTQYRFKDVEIKCTHFAPSGTEIDANTRIIYEVVEAHSTKKIKQMNMGFIHSQAAGSRCAN